MSTYCYIKLYHHHCFTFFILIKNIIVYELRKLHTSISTAKLLVLLVLSSSRSILSHDELFQLEHVFYVLLHRFVRDVHAFFFTAFVM